MREREGGEREREEREEREREGGRERTHKTGQIDTYAISHTVMYTRPPQGPRGGLWGLCLLCIV